MEPSFYDSIWRRKRRGSGRSEFPSSRTSIAESLVPAGANALLDCGAGDGFFIERFKGRIERIVGIDFSREAVEAGREGGLDILLGDLSKGLPFDDASFDCVTLLDTIEHIFDPRPLLAEAVRVLAPGGTIIVSTPNIQYYRHILSILTGRFPRTSGDGEGYDGGHIHYFAHGNLEYELDRLGIGDIVLRGYGGRIRESSLLIPLFSPGIIIAGRRR